MGYIEKTTKQYQLWASDLKHIIKSHTVKFAESEKGGTIDLRLQQQTPNVLLNRRLIEHSWKKPITVEVTVSDQAPTTQDSEMQPDLIMIKANKPQREQHEAKLTTVNLDKLSGEKIDTDQVKTVTPKGVKTFLCVEIPK